MADDVNDGRDSIMPKKLIEIDGNSKQYKYALPYAQKVKTWGVDK